LKIKMLVVTSKAPQEGDGRPVKALLENMFRFNKDCKTLCNGCTQCRVVTAEIQEIGLR